MIRKVMCGVGASLDLRHRGRRTPECPAWTNIKQGNDFEIFASNEAGNRSLTRFEVTSVSRTM
ncbi:MAG: hypothetical protein ACRC35_00055 [Angustibacter sp.]